MDCVAAHFAAHVWPTRFTVGVSASHHHHLWIAVTVVWSVRVTVMKDSIRFMCPARPSVTNGRLAAREFKSGRLTCVRSNDSSMLQFLMYRISSNRTRVSNTSRVSKEAGGSDTINCSNRSGVLLLEEIRYSRTSTNRLPSLATNVNLSIIFRHATDNWQTVKMTVFFFLIRVHERAGANVFVLLCVSFFLSVCLQKYLNCSDACVCTNLY